MPIDTALHARTPTILAFEPRGLASRKVAYHRRVAADVAQARIERVGHDAAGRIVSLWDARLPQPCLRNRRALSGATLRSTHVDAGWRAALHGAASEPAYAWDARGVVSRFVHDDLGRTVAAHEGIGMTRCLERLVYGTPSDTTGAAGRIIRHDDTSGSMQIPSYSVHGSPTAERRRYLLATDEPDWPEAIGDRDRLLEKEAFESRWLHDARGTPWQQTDAGGHVRRHVFDVSGRPLALHVTIEGEDERVVSKVTGYDADYRVTRRRNGDVETTAIFDPATGHQVGLRSMVAGRAIQDLTYTYDGVGNVTSMGDVVRATDWFDATGTDPLHRYDYDTLDQLIRAYGRESVLVDGTGVRPPLRVPGDTSDNRLRNYVEEYDYDTGGNLIAMMHTVADVATVRKFIVEVGSNRAVPVGEEGKITFDATGNRLQLRPGVPLAWDARGRLGGVGLPASLDERYAYDAGGRRTRKSTSASEVRYVPGLERRTGPGALACDILHLPHAGGFTCIVHGYAGNPPADPRDLQRVQVSDLLGSVCLEVTANGTVLSEEAFHPFGSSALWAARDASAAERKSRHYSGKEMDATGLSYYGHRYYAAWLGRWLSTDPAGDADGPNRYRFARNNPCSGVDREGWMFRHIRKDSRSDRLVNKLMADRDVARADAVGGKNVRARMSGFAVLGEYARIAEGLEWSLSTIYKASHALFRAPERSRPIVEKLLGFEAEGLSHSAWGYVRETLLDGLNEMRKSLEPLRNESDQRLVLVDPSSDKSMTDVQAYVYPADPQRRIFLVKSNIGTNGPDMNPIRDVFLHEPTHQFPRGARTADVKYFPTGRVPKSAAHWANAYKAPSRRGGLSEIGEIGAISDIAGYRHMSVEERKLQIVMRNADTWRVLAIELSTVNVDDWSKT